MKKMQLSKIAYKKQMDNFLKMADSEMVVGHNYFKGLKEKSVYYISTFGSHDMAPKLIGILDANETSNMDYYSIKISDEQRVSPVYLIERESSFVYGGNNEMIIEWLNKHPFSLYFCGSDDGSLIKVFETKNDAIKYLERNPSFKDVLSENSQKIKDVETLYKSYPDNNFDSMLSETLFYIN